MGKVGWRGSEVLRNILRPKITNVERRLRPYKELYQKTEGVVTLMSREGYQLYGH